MTENRIIEWHDHWEGKVYVAFSGGKDSTVLAHMVHDWFPNVPLVFSNTGLEYPEIQAFARKMGAVFVRPKMMFSEVISKYGYPIISKENAEAIYYARRIRNGGGYLSTERKREEFSGERVYGQPAPEPVDGRQRETEYRETERRRADITGNEPPCMDDKRRNLLTGGNGRINGRLEPASNWQEARNGKRWRLMESVMREQETPPG